jgi:hypothetical protein
MEKLKTVVIFMFGGAFLGNLVASLVMPRYIAWNNDAPLATQQQCKLVEVIPSVTSDLIGYQLMGSGIGAVIFLVLGLVFLQARARKQKSTPPPTAPTPTPTQT